jgi:hypothetical protein
VNEAFKKQLETDLTNAWFNLNEFCDYHIVDGVRMRVLFDEHELTKNDQSGKHTEGLYRDLLLVFVPCSDFGPKPRTGRVINLDGKKTYRVADVMTEDGMYRMQLEAYKG